MNYNINIVLNRFLNFFDEHKTEREMTRDAVSESLNEFIILQLQPYQIRLLKKDKKYLYEYVCKKYQLPPEKKTYPLFECELCKLKFTNQYNYQTHMQTHVQPITEIKEQTKYQCILCQKEFLNEYNLQTHALTHAQKDNV